MMSPTKTLALLALSSFILFACKSIESPDAQLKGDQLWTDIQGRSSWASFPGFEGILKGKKPHGKFVRTYVNSVGAADMQNLPVGTVVVKENFSKSDEGSLSNLTVMKRMPTGYDEFNADWFYANYSASGSLELAGRDSFCIDCHASADMEDFIFLNDE